MYRVVYDATAPLMAGHFQIDSALNVLAGFLAVGVMLAIFFKILLRGDEAPHPMRFFPYVFLGLAVFFTIFECSLYFSSLANVRDAFSRHRETVVEGRVQEYTPWEPHVHSATLVVDGVRFQFWAYINEGALDAAGPVPIRVGDGVRLTAVGNSIVKVEQRQ